MPDHLYICDAILLRDHLALKLQLGKNECAQSLIASFSTFFYSVGGRMWVTEGAAVLFYQIIL